MKLKHGHRKQVKRPCKYYNQSGCTEISRKYSQYFKVGSLLQELTGLKEGMDSIESMVKKQMNRTPINIRTIPNLRSKSTKHASKQQDIKQIEQVKELKQQIPLMYVFLNCGVC
eukprot:219813_1